jgi:pilus assembly protein Flp/PilA
MEKLQEFAVKAQNSWHATTGAVRDERGAAGVEYGLLVALIAAVIIGTVQLLGTQINSAFQAITNVL